MILTLSIILGLLASLTRARIKKHPLMPPQLNHLWLIPVALTLQVLALRLGSSQVAAAGLVGSQIILLIFAKFNYKHSGFLLLIIGLGLNLLVIVLNGGLMPITPEMVERIGVSPTAWVGHRLGISKDIVLPITETRFWVLSDRFFLSLLGYRVAFSLGDVFIAAGAFWLTWAMSARRFEQKTAKILPTTTILHQQPIFHRGRTVPLERQRE